MCRDAAGLLQCDLCKDEDSRARDYKVIIYLLCGEISKKEIKTKMSIHVL